MKLCEINPFVRFASKFVNHGHFEPVRAHDARIFYITEDGGTLTTLTDVIPLQKSTLIYIPPGAQYCIDCVGQQPVFHFVIAFDFTRENDHLTEFIPPDNARIFSPAELYTALPEPFDEILILQGFVEAEKSLIDICFEFHAKQFEFDTAISALLKSTLVLLARKRDTQSYFPLIKQIMKHVHENYSEHLSTKNIGKALSYNSVYLDRIFKQHTGMTIHHYINIERISTAQKLLRTTNFTIEAISALCGFKTASHFSQCFKRITGQLPNKFRKNNRMQV